MSKFSALRAACTVAAAAASTLGSLTAFSAELFPHPEAERKFEEIEKSIFLYSEKPYAIEQAMVENEVAGMSIVLLYDGKPALHRTYGYRVKKKDLKTNSSTTYQCASMSKMVSALGVVTAARRGKLDLDQSLSSFNASHKNGVLARWADKQFKKDTENYPRDITPRRLLSHTAGLNVHGISAAPWLPSNEPIENILFGRSIFKQAVKPIHEPGTKYDYSGGGYVVAEAWLETATGMKFKDYLKQQVLDPLGMSRSTFETASEDTPNLAWGCSRGVCMYNVRTLDVKAAGGLICHPVDYARLVGVMLNDGKEYKPEGAGTQLIHADDVKAIITPSRHKDTNAIINQYGLGAGLSSYQADDGLTVRFAHGGKHQGFSNEFYAHRGQKVGIVVLVNGDHQWTRHRETYGGGTLSTAVLEAFKVAFDIVDEGKPLQPRCSKDTDCGDGEYCNAGIDIHKNECVAKKADNESCDLVSGGRQCKSGKCNLGRCYTPKSVAMGGTCYCDDACKKGKCSAVDGTKGSCVCKIDSDCDPGEYCDAGFDTKKNVCRAKLAAGQSCGKVGSVGNDHKCQSGKCSGFPKYECK